MLSDTAPPTPSRGELEELAGEAIGWIPLEDRAYLQLGDVDATVVLVTGVPDAELADRAVLPLV